jgi:hypothetical protein
MSQGRAAIGGIITRTNDALELLQYAAELEERLEPCS